MNLDTINQIGGGLLILGIICIACDPFARKEIDRLYKIRKAALDLQENKSSDLKRSVDLKSQRERFEKSVNRIKNKIILKWGIALCVTGILLITIDYIIY